MRTAAVLLLTLIGTGSLSAQKVTLIESPKEGDCFSISAETTLNGSLKVARDEKVVPVRVSAVNRHAFVERVMSTEKGLIRKAVRKYDKADSEATVGDEKMQRGLRADRRLIVAQRTGDSLFCYSPAGPLSRNELEMVSEHFDTLPISGLLSGKETAVGETWKISPVVVQSVCLFDGLLSGELTGTLTEMKGGTALIKVAGTAKGIEAGAMASLTVDAELKFDTTSGRIVQIVWRQKDSRDQGPITPAAELETVTTVDRKHLSEEPTALSKTALAVVPSEDDPPGVVKQLVLKEDAGRFQLVHAREWHAVGQTDQHTVLRLLDRGDFVAQATITVWKNAGAGKHISGDEFQKLVAGSPGWQMEQIIDHGEVPTEEGRWMYRVTARGDLDGVRVVQSFYVAASPSGEQMIVTFTMKPANQARLGTRDLAIVAGLEFLKK